MGLAGQFGQNESPLSFLQNGSRLRISSDFSELVKDDKSGNVCDVNSLKQPTGSLAYALAVYQCRRLKSNKFSAKAGIQ